MKEIGKRIECKEADYSRTVKDLCLKVLSKQTFSLIRETFLEIHKWVKKSTMCSKSKENKWLSKNKEMRKLKAGSSLK